MEIVFTRDLAIDIFRRMSEREHLDDILKDTGVTRAVWNKYKYILVPEMKGKRVKTAGGNTRPIPQNIIDEVNEIFEHCETYNKKFFAACEDLGLSHGKYSKWARLINIERYTKIKLRNPVIFKVSRCPDIGEKNIIAIMKAVESGKKLDDELKKYGISKYNYYKSKMRVTGVFVPYYDRCVTNPKFRKLLAQKALKTMRDEKKTFVEACKSYKRYTMSRIYDCIGEFFPEKIDKMDFGFSVDNMNPVKQKDKQLSGFENIEKKNVVIVTKIREEIKIARASKRLHCENCKLRMGCKVDKLSIDKCPDRKLDIEYELRKIEKNRIKRIRKEGL